MSKKMKTMDMNRKRFRFFVRWNDRLSRRRRKTFIIHWLMWITNKMANRFYKPVQHPTIYEDL